MENNDNSAIEKVSFKNLRCLYIFALLTIAVTVLLSQLIIQYNLNSQLSDSRIINSCGKQRFLNQKLTKEILILNFVTKTKDNNAQINKINKIIKLWKSNQYALENGNGSLGFPKEKSKEISNLYKSINPNFNTILKGATSFLNNKKMNTYDKENQELVRTIIVNSAIFMDKMDEIVGQYDKEAIQKVRLKSRTEYSILFFTMLVLLLEFIFIFKPTNEKVEQLISKLLASEKKALKLARDTETINEIKENSVKELKSLNYAMENTLLYCRVTPDGSLIHMGEKFSKLLKYNPFDSDKTFSHALTPIEKEREILERIFLENQRTGWQGELNITIRNDQSIWLDLSIVPMTIKNDESELLVICFDITELKKTEQEIERLNNENFNDKVNQQKIISNKIVENQENEQNRIAKEIHDGIGQMLTGLKFSLESINIEDKEKSAQKIEYLKILTLDIIKGVRTATFNLMPPELSDHGIVSALAKLAQELSKLTGKNVIFYNKTDFDIRLDSLTEINIYRLTQEAINNAIKYANSTHIIVQLSHSKNLLSITIDDNGKGFDIGAAEKKRKSESGMGLLFMKERIQYINGRFFINSILDEGTSVIFNIPI